MGKYTPEEYANMTEEKVKSLNNELANIFSKNPNRINKTYEYSEEGKDFSEVISDYFNEMKRVKTVYDNHLKAISGDNSVSSENYMPVIDKISALEEAFLAFVDSDDVRENAQGYFETIKSSVQQFAGFLQGIEPDQSVKDFNIETLLKPISTIGDCTMLLGQIADKQTNIPPERQALLKNVVSQMENIKLKNAPGNPEKDMLGIPKINVIDVCYAKFLMPLKLGRHLANSYTSDQQFPKDPAGYDAFSKLKNQIDSFDKKTRAMYFNEEGVTITKDDYINMARALKNVAENGALFAADSPNGQKSQRQSINQVANYSKAVLSEMAQLYSDVPEIKEIAKTAEGAYLYNCKREYQKLQKEAFSGDILKDPKAKTAWAKMTVLKNQYKELDTQFQKDRMSMMVINADFCLQQVSNAENTLQRIEEKGADASVTNENRMLTAEDSKSKYMAEVRNDALMTQMFGIGLSVERQINSNPKATAEEKFIGGNEKLNDIASKDLATKYRYAKQRTEAFLAHRESFKELAPKPNENLLETTKALKGMYGYEGFKANNQELKNKINRVVTHSNDSLNLDYKRLSSIIKQGTPEANALRSQITSYSEKTKNGEDISVDDKLMLFKASKDYLHKKSSIPMTQFGKNRVDAATEVMGKVGIELLSDSKNAAAFDDVRKEMEIEMLRNPKFRQEMTTWAQGVINKNVELGTPLNKEHPEFFAAAGLLAFGKAADAAMPNPKKNYIETKLDKPEKINKIKEQVSGIEANAKDMLANSLQDGFKGLKQFANEPVLSQAEYQKVQEVQAIKIFR